VDGRGIGYRKKARLNWMRGTQVRKVKDHIRCEVMMTKGRYKLIQYVGVGKRYSLEIKLLREILKGVDLSGERFLADRLYDVRWLREYLRDRGIRGFFPTTCMSHIFSSFLYRLISFHIELSLSLHENFWNTAIYT